MKAIKFILAGIALLAITVSTSYGQLGIIPRYGNVFPLGGGGAGIGPSTNILAISNWLPSDSASNAVYKGAGLRLALLACTATNPTDEATSALLTFQLQDRVSTNWYFMNGFTWTPAVGKTGTFITTNFPDSLIGNARSWRLYSITNTATNTLFISNFFWSATP